MRILILPCNDGNTYQPPLVFELTKLGVSIDEYNDLINLFPIYRSWRGGKRKPDIVNLHWIQFYLLSYTALRTIVKSVLFLLDLAYAKLKNIRIVWTIHNAVSHESNYPGLELFFNNLICLFCDEYIVQSQSIKNEISLKYRTIINKSKIKVIPRGNYIDLYQNTIAKIEARRYLNLGLKDIVFISFGKIRPYKGIDQLIDAWELFQAEMNRDDIKLIIVGHPHNDHVEKEILRKCTHSKNVIPILRYINDEEIQIYMNAADICLFTFTAILGSASVVAAMSYKKAVIAPNMGGIPDLIDENGGLIYRANDRNDLLQALKKSIRLDYEKMGEHNYEIIKNNTWQKTAIKQYEIFSKLIN
ncbi:MAG: glycosyltransferase family 4 protein [Dehalococcoidia bacterium]|jgi:glycosyltransferase involved in cell wall biosynthesis